MTQGRYSQLAQEVGAWLVGASADGRSALVGDNILEAFPHNDHVEIELALFELA